MITAQEARELNHNSYREFFERFVEPTIRSAAITSVQCYVTVIREELQRHGLNIIGLRKFMEAEPRFNVSIESHPDRVDDYELCVNWQEY